MRQLKNTVLRIHCRHQKVLLLPTVQGLIRWRAKTHYQTLGLDVNATESEIKAAYYEKSKLYHPDSSTGAVDRRSEFIAVQNSYNVLKDRDLRRQYDQIHFGTTREPISSDGGRSHIKPDYHPHPPAAHSYGYQHDQITALDLLYPVLIIVICASIICHERSRKASKVYGRAHRRNKATANMKNNSSRNHLNTQNRDNRISSSFEAGSQIKGFTKARPVRSADQQPDSISDLKTWK